MKCMNTNTNTNHTRDLVRKLDAYVSDPENFGEEGLHIFCRNVMMDLDSAYRDIESLTFRVQETADELQRRFKTGSNLASVADSLAQRSSDLSVAQAKFDSALRTLRQCLYHAANNGDKPAIKALFC